MHNEKSVSTIRSPGNLPQRISSDLVVKRSWQRCMSNHGLDPHHTPPPSVLSQAEFKEVAARSSDLISIARFEIDRLFTQIGSDHYVVLLTDMQGVTIDFRCPAPLRNSARRAGLNLGSVWSESEQGTNGVGTCVYESRPLSIVREEHFSARNAALTCIVSPIFAAENRLIGVLDVATEQPTNAGTQTLLQCMVAAAAQRIENLCFEQRHRSRSIVRISPYRDFADSATEARLALADNGSIFEAGSNASRLLASEGLRLAGLDLSQLLRTSVDALARAEAPLTLHMAHGQVLYARIEERDSMAAASAFNARRQRPGKTEAGQADAPRYDLAALAGDDPTMLANVDIACRMFKRGLPIVITGETGSGKGLFAQALHSASARRAGPFVAINCAAIPQELIESELFGYRPGAFTGASAEGFKGRLLQANTGTLFLDEIGDMPLALQTRLLQVLSDGEFTPIGATRPVALDVAVVSATLHDLQSRVRAGQFREDLFFRLSGVTLALPPLRLRKDSRDLIRRVFAEEAEQADVSIGVHEGTLEILASHFWPGNLRELRHVARFAVALAEGRSDVILPSHLPPSFAKNVTSKQDGGSMKSGNRATPETQIVEAALKRAAGNVTAAATLLGVSRATLHRKLRKYGLRSR